jgi:GNAT superfamily N-acetyltransferase
MSVKTVLSNVIRDPDLAVKLWHIYVRAFEKASREAVQDQMCYTEATLTLALTDPEYAKFLIYRDEEPIGFGLVTNDMDKARIAYVNPGYLKAKLPQEYAERRLYYFTAIAVLPELQGQGSFFASMASEMTAYIDRLGGIVVFDYSMETSPLLPALLQRAIQAAQKQRHLTTDGTSYEELGGQRYGLIRFVAKP